MCITWYISRVHSHPHKTPLFYSPRGLSFCFWVWDNVRWLWRRGALLRRLPRTFSSALLCACQLRLLLEIWPLEGQAHFFLSHDQRALKCRAKELSGLIRGFELARSAKLVLSTEISYQCLLLPNPHPGSQRGKNTLLPAPFLRWVHSGRSLQHIVDRLTQYRPCKSETEALSLWSLSSASFHGAWWRMEGVTRQPLISVTILERIPG